MSRRSGGRAKRRTGIQDLPASFVRLSIQAADKKPGNQLLEKTMTLTANGRKSLAEQIDRLDGILDGLAAGLNEAVAAAMKNAVVLAVREAIQTVLIEILANPHILERI